VLLDKNSIVVAYDYKRGEQRAKLVRQEIKKEHSKCAGCNGKGCNHIVEKAG
jgi:hypothetical protein